MVNVNDETFTSLLAFWLRAECSSSRGCFWGHLVTRPIDVGCVHCGLAKGILPYVQAATEKMEMAASYVLSCTGGKMGLQKCVHPLMALIKKKNTLTHCDLMERRIKGIPKQRLGRGVFFVFSPFFCLLLQNVVNH